LRQVENFVVVEIRDSGISGALEQYWLAKNSFPEVTDMSEKVGGKSEDPEKI
jgi:hypothetical protein